MARVGLKLQRHQSFVSVARCARSVACLSGRRGQASNSQAILYVAKCPLAGMSTVTKLVPPSQLPANVSHWMVLIQDPGSGTCTVLDFLPQNPLAPKTALQLLSGEIRRHKFKRDPPFPRHRLGTLAPDWQADADAFCAKFDSRLHLVQNDCKAFVVGLSEQLLGAPAPPLTSLSMALPSTRVEPTDSMPDILDW